MEVAMATMQVLLREDVDNVGRRGEIVRVKAGFARNYLLPRNLAIMASAVNVKTIERERKLLERREVQECEAAKTMAERLKDISLEFARKAGEQGVFYGSVNAHDIAQALEERGFDIERRRLYLESPIKEPGQYSVKVKLHRDIILDLPVTARAEGAEAPVGSDPAPSAEALSGEPSEPDPDDRGIDGGPEEDPEVS
jgi:large subunit ribosomal protein L9